MKRPWMSGMVFPALIAALSLASAAGLHAAAAPVAGGVPAARDVTNPFAGKPEAVKEGEKLFDEKCSECHMDGTGGAGPNLTDDTWVYGGTDADVFETIAYGRKDGMPSWKSELGAENIWKIIAYIRSIHRP
ncbi:MAG: c-type cytochrome [Nitrospirota bacterium]